MENSDDDLPALTKEEAWALRNEDLTELEKRQFVRDIKEIARFVVRNCLREMRRQSDVSKHDNA